MSKFPHDKYPYDVHHDYENDGYRGGLTTPVQHSFGNYILLFLLTGVFMYFTFLTNDTQPKGEQHNGTEQTDSTQGNKIRQ
jgi:hypothetical protein